MCCVLSPLPQPFETAACPLFVPWICNNLDGEDSLDEHNGTFANQTNVVFCHEKVVLLLANTLSPAHDLSDLLIAVADVRNSHVIRGRHPPRFIQFLCYHICSYLGEDSQWQR